MVTNKSKKPELRFKGFSDDWEQRKWIDTVDISTEMVDPTSGEYDDLPHIAPGNIESFTGRILDNVKSVKEEQLISGKFRFKPGDVIYGKINPQLGKYFYACVDGLTSADAYVFNGKNGITQNFLFSLLQTEDFFKYSVSVSKRSGMPKINRDELNAYCFLAPDEEEQNIIGNFLLNIDNLITLHQSKCDKLKIIKKLMLNNLFPKNGEKNPKWRFNGFNDDWEQRKLEDFVSFYSGLTYTPDDVRDSGTLVLRSSNVKDGEITLDDNVYVSPETVNSENVKPGDLVVVVRNGSRNLIGKHAQIKHLMHNTVIGAFMTGIRSEHAEFVNALLDTPRFKRDVDINIGATINQITGYMFSHMEFMVPSEREQDQIGAFFRDLDHLITLHQSEVERLKKVKQFFLDKMFI